MSFSGFSEFQVSFTNKILLVIFKMSPVVYLQECLDNFFGTTITCGAGEMVTVDLGEGSKKP